MEKWAGIGLYKTFALFFRKVVLLLVNFLCNHNYFFRLIGRINKRNNFMESVFLAYPAGNEYASAYAFRFVMSSIKWRPWISGFLKQNGKYILMLAISARDGDIASEKSKENLKSLVASVDKIKVMTGAKSMTFAGILPGILFLRRIVRNTPEADLTAAIVAQAIRLVLIEELLNKRTPIILLGGNGFIGKRVMKLLEGRNVFCVDIGSDGKMTEYPNRLSGQQVLVVNITKFGVIDSYLNQMWSGTIILNEVYPEPSNETLELMKKIGCHCYHVVGVRASAVPRFPGAYNGAIPCCAAWSSPNAEAVICRLV